MKFINEVNEYLFGGTPSVGDALWVYGAMALWITLAAVVFI